MNILYVEHYAGSPEMGMEFRPYYLAREWVKMGHNVSIIAGDYSHLRKQNPSVSSDLEKQTIDGINYYWLKTGSYSGNGAARAFTMFSFCWKLIRYKKWINTHLNPDVVISSSTYPIDAIPTHIISKHRKGNEALHIHEVHDMWPSTLVELGGMSRINPFVVLMQYGENYAYRHSDAVVSLPKYAKTYMVEHGLRENRFFNVPNGIIEDEWNNPEPLPKNHLEILSRLKTEGKFVVGYFGGHALSNCLMTLIQTAKQLKCEDNISFVLVGDGVEKESLVEYVEAHELNNVLFLPPVPKKAIPTLTDYFDCIYIGAKDSPLYRFGVAMNKMFDGMMSAKPIIFAINAQNTPVEECGCGMIVKPENTNEIVSAIHKLVDMSKSERQEMGLRGRREVLNKYTYSKLAEDFLNVISEVGGSLIGEN